LILKETIQEINDTARVEEVVGEFVNLKKWRRPTLDCTLYKDLAISCRWLFSLLVFYAEGNTEAI